jgi:transposase
VACAHIDRFCGLGLDGLPEREADVDRCAGNLPIIEQSHCRAEVLSGPERRRRWSAEEKARIVAESLAPEAVASVVARRHGIHRNQLYGWRRDLRRAAALEASALPHFVSVSVTPEAQGLVAVEICLAGAVVRVVPGVDLAFLAEVLRVMRAQG